MPVLIRPQGPLDYETNGTGDAVLLIHGTAHDASVWDRLVEVLAIERRVITYDRRGCGDSHGRPVTDFRVHTADAAALLTRLEADPAIVVAWSSGGTIAIDLAVAHRGLVSGLVLVEPVATRARVHSWRLWRTLLGNLPAAIRGRDREAAERIMRWIFANQRGPNAWEARGADQRERVLANAATLTAEVYRSFRRSLFGVHLKARELAAIAAPVEVLFGELSQEWFRKTSRYMPKLIPQARLTEVRGATHWLPVEAPEAVLAAVRRVAEDANQQAAV